MDAEQNRQVTAKEILSMLTGQKSSVCHERFAKAQKSENGAETASNNEICADAVQADATEGQ